MSPDQSLRLDFDDGWEAVGQVHRARRGTNFRLGFLSSDPEVNISFAVHSTSAPDEYVFVLPREGSSSPVTIFDLEVYESWAALTAKQGLSQDMFEPDLADQHIRMQEEMGMIVPNPDDVRDFKRLITDFADAPERQLIRIV